MIVASTVIGAGVLAAAGAREWSWSAPAVGLAAATMLAWWTVRLPGHGWSALAALMVASLAAGGFAASRIECWAVALRDGAPVLLLALLGASIPFVVEGHFGVLGSGFNVDMSQHLFAASWIADPTGNPPGLFTQGYPLGPHALAVATGEVSGNLVTAFSGVTVALPVIVALAALAALGATGGWPRWRAVIAAALVGFAYLAASYFAQGSFKELFEVAFLLGFVIWLGELATAREAATPSWRAGLSGAVLAGGTLYAYSAPGLAWLLGTLLVWGALELVRGRRHAAAIARRSLPALAAGLIALAILASPEIDRIIDFGGSVGTVSDAGAAGGGGGGRKAGPGHLGGADEPRAEAQAAGAGASRAEIPKFDNDLGNLFGQISPLEALGVWPSGDFRVAPGDGAVPAVVFYAGALLGALALALGVASAARAGETALFAALTATAAIWLAARIGSTPYTTAKALVLLGATAMALAARGVLGPGDGVLARSGPLRAALALAFVGAAGLSSALALANAPVGPSDYTPGVRDLADSFAGRPTLLLAPDEVIADQHGTEFYGWELRAASPACVAPSGSADPELPPPPPAELVLTTQPGAQRPYAGLRRVASREGVTLWRSAAPRSRILIPLPDRDAPTPICSGSQP